MSGNLFIVFTPFQLINATTIILQEELNNNTLLLLNNCFDYSSIKMSVLEGNVFQEIVTPKFSKANGINFISTYKEINKQKNKYKRIYASSEATLFIQATMKNNPQADYYHFEDGSFDYSNSREKYDWVRFIGSNIYVLLSTHFQHRYNKVLYPGTIKNIKGIYALYPENLREEMKAPKYKIDCDIFRKVVDMLFNKGANVSNSTVICLDHSEVVDDTYLNGIKMILVQSNLVNQKIFLKYHPREKNFYLDDMLSSKIIKVRSEIPIEKYIINASNTNVVSNLSSSMHTLKFLNPSINIICISNIIKSNFAKNNKKYLVFLKNTLQIEFAENYRELNLKINSK